MAIAIKAVTTIPLWAALCMSTTGVAGPEPMASGSQTDSEPGYFVAFVGREASLNSNAGHAFVILGKGTPMACNVDGGDGEAFGFYPVTTDNPCNNSETPPAKNILKMRPVPSCLVNDAHTPYDTWVAVPCTFDEYIIALGVVHVWKAKTYELGERDCLSLMIDVAATVDGKLRLPERTGALNFPHQYVEELKRLNPDL